MLIRGVVAAVRVVRNDSKITPLVFFCIYNILCECCENHPTCSSWNVVFIGGNRFALSIIVFEKLDVKVGVRIRPTFNFYAAVALLC